MALGAGAEAHTGDAIPPLDGDAVGGEGPLVGEGAARPQVHGVPLGIGVGVAHALRPEEVVVGLHQGLDLGILPLGLNAGDLRFIELGVKVRPAYICSGQSLSFGKKGVQVVPLPLQKQDQHHYRQIDPPMPYTLGCVHDCAQSQDDQP